MAVKDHSLDGKIVEAAKQEFLQKGFQQASLHEICRKAGITTGALYTRYKNKDALFCSLAQEVFEAVGAKGAEVYQMYQQAQNSGDPMQIMQVIRKEQEIYQELLFSHYDACVLLYCRSAGSSLETTISQMMEQKTAQTIEYFKSVSKTDLDLDGIGIIMSEQFHFFRQILEKGYSKEKTLQCMKTVEIYQQAGWEALFEAIL